MDITISDIMQKNIFVVNVDDSIAHVESFLTENKLSFIPVTDDENNCFGVISDYDILKFHQDNRNSKLEHAWEVCSHSILSVDRNVSVLDAANLVIDNKVHHLVVSSRDAIDGVISSIDLLKYFVKQV